MARTKRQVNNPKARTRRTKLTPKREETHSTETEELKQRLDVLARGIDSRRVEIELRTNELAEMQDEAERIMHQLNMNKFEVARVGTHEIYEKMGRASSKIDVEAYWDHCSEEQFFSTVTVTAKAASEVLPSKTIEQITERTPAESKGPAYKFTPAGTK